MIYYTTHTLYVQIKAVSVRNRAYLAIVAYLPKQLTQIVNYRTMCRGVVGVRVPGLVLVLIFGYFWCFLQGESLRN